MVHRNEKPESGERTDTPVDATPARDTEPTGIDLGRTLPTGAAFQATWKLPAWRPSAAPQVETPHESGVRRLDLPGTAQVPSADQRAAAQSRVQTLASLPPFESHPAPPAPAQNPTPSGHAESLHGRTIRMDIGLPRMAHPPANAHQPGSAPAATTPPPTAARKPQPAAAFILDRHGAVLATSVQPVGEARDTDTVSTRPSARSTDPLGHLAPAYTPDDPTHSAGQPEHGRAPGATQSQPESRRAPARAGAASPAPHSHHRREEEATWEPPLPSKSLRALGPLAWTIVLGAIGAALWGLYFGMRPASFETESTSAEPAATSAEAHVVTPAPLARSNAALQTSRTTGPSASLPAANTTELVSTPASAEIVFGGAVIANTPARFTRPPYESDYLVRMPGYAPELVRIGPTSPQTVSITLKPLPPEAQRL